MSEQSFDRAALEAPEEGPNAGILITSLQDGEPDREPDGTRVDSPTTSE